MRFDCYIGIDYSGRGEPDRRTPAIQLVEMNPPGFFRRISPDGAQAKTFGWSRKEVYEYVRDALLERNRRLAIGIDHSLSFPAAYFAEHGLQNWDALLEHFVQNWNTKEQPVSVCREKAPGYPNAKALRLTETFTASAKSAWNFEQKTGAVSYSTHAGLPWMYELRSAVRDTLHVWPFDGWEPPAGKSVLAEVYPALLYQRYKQFAADFPQDWPRDAQDAYVIAAWLRERDQNGTLERYFRADTLTEREKRMASQTEGWILGVC
ncbi:hypothetical protein [Paenibacillus sp. EPM92]|uniref:hypothetical protein n=1 Tax=Paenibacillus sp. EPM92 TaxID=1561195 RepID=UPI001915ABF3|nr:hypothetical protein [Paenibacillus sp. EPM92]